MIHFQSCIFTQYTTEFDSYFLSNKKCIFHDVAVASL